MAIPAEADGYPGGGDIPAVAEATPVAAVAAIPAAVVASGQAVPAVAAKHVDGKKILERMANETGGRLFEVSKKQDTAQIYTQIAEELRAQYRLGYTPDQPPPPTATTRSISRSQARQEEELLHPDPRRLLHRQIAVPRCNVTKI